MLWDDLAKQGYVRQTDTFFPDLKVGPRLPCSRSLRALEGDT